jgi:hypothetical protein
MEVKYAGRRSNNLQECRVLHDSHNIRVLPRVLGRDPHKKAKGTGSYDCAAAGQAKPSTKSFQSKKSQGQFTLFVLVCSL